MADLIDQLKRHEGAGPLRNGRHYPYRCPAGRLTLGYGRNLQDRGISPEEAEMLLRNDIKAADAALRWHLPWYAKLDRVRQEALINMTINLGVVGLLKFKDTLRYIEAGHYAAAEKAMLDSRWAKQVGARARELGRQIRTGGYA